GGTMLFNSFVFIFLFLPITLIGYFLLNNYGKEKWAKAFLVLGSLYFYSYFNPKYTYLIVLSILVNYFVGNTISKHQKTKMFGGGVTKTYFIAGLVFNIGMLFYFKYYDFFIENMNSIFSINLPILKLMLPLGISFFTFQQLSFLVDSYRGKGGEHDFLSYSLFVTFFPQLIAGPIVLPEEMLPQFENHDNKKINYENMNRGLYLFSIGLAKKVLIADSISPFADAGFDKMASLTFIEGWLTSISYTMQLYFDFSGYCDMAMGIALMFNIILPLNFNSPYKSTNIQDFWKRWHMTLGRFLTNYLYIPIGGNRGGELKTLRNLLIVFLVSGIWHGAGWNFIIWGALHGLAILIHRTWKNKGYKMSALLGWALTLFSVNIFWVFFRAKDLAGAAKVLKAMLDYRSIGSLITESYKVTTNPYLGNKISLLLLVISIIIAIVFKNSFEKNRSIKFCNINCFEMAVYSVSSILLLKRVATFLYFNF
ncbi:MAG: MBOAT family O-acyltransferase, partial [Fusobacteriaceae bacterium]